MLVHPSLSTESTGPDLKNGRVTATPAAAARAASLTPAADPALSRLHGLSALDGNPEIQDDAGADQALQSVRAGMVSQPASALSAQAGLNPETVFDLLR